MKLGIVRENRPNERRAILRPAELKAIADRHDLFVEKGVGEGIGIDDSEYEQIGGKITTAEQAYSSDLVVRLKEPIEEELAMMRPGGAIMSMFHLPGNPHLRALLKAHRVIAIAMEEIKDPFGRRMIEALHQTGYLGMEKGFELWEGEPSECVVKIMGYGNVALGAIQCAARQLAQVTVLNKRDFEDMSRHILGTDILVNAINWPMEKRGKVFVITCKMLTLFKEGAIILDLIANPPGHSPIETIIPSSLDFSPNVIDGVTHSSCWGWPGFDPMNISRRYSIQVAPILEEIADKGLDDLPEYIRKATHREF